MNTSEKYRQNAEECRRIAQSLSGDGKAMLLKIADAWNACAEEAEGKANSGHNASGAKPV